MARQPKHRRIAKIRAAFRGEPMAIDTRALNRIEDALQSNDLDGIRAALSFGEQEEATFSIVNGVAVIPVTSVLRDPVDYMVRWGYASSYQQIERDFRGVLADSQIKAILFYCDSPGGSAIGCKRIADLIFASRGQKPIVAYVQGMCASACFYIASACDRIDATADSLVASVGTIYPHMEFSKAFDEFGAKTTVFTNVDSPKKGHGNIYEPLTPDSRKTLQEFVEAYGKPFIADVARYRGITTQQVVSTFGQGDAMRADVAQAAGLIDSIVGGFADTLNSLSTQSEAAPVKESDRDATPVTTGQTTISRSSDMDPKVKAQLFALGLIDAIDASDDVCNVALRAWFRGDAVPQDTASILIALRTPAASQAEDPEDEDTEDGEEKEEGGGKPESKARPKPAKNVQQAHNTEQSEARFADLCAARDLVNKAAGYEAVTSDMVLSAQQAKQGHREAMAAWSKSLSDAEPSIPTGRTRVTSEGRDRYAQDAITALAIRAGANVDQPSEGAQNLVNRPLWAVAAECLQMAGERVDIYGDREHIAQQAMEMGTPGRRHTFYSANEQRQYISAGAVPSARPGDFPNILSGLANKFLDTVQLDDDYSYPAVSAVLPGGLNDFKPAMMVNKGIVEELDELQDAEEFKQLGLSEEVLSYIFLRRFGNKWGWTPVMIANDDLGAFAEGMLGLEEAWQVTQNRLIVDLFTSNPTLLDGSALFANRTDVGSATNHNIVTGGAAPSDAQWGLMETAYADIGGIATSRRVRGMLNVCYAPTGAVYQAARRTFFNYQMLGETKQAATDANINIYRGQVSVVPESELRGSSAIIWYGLRNPTRLNTATVVRAYFNGFGTAGRRERWYDPENKTTWVSIEGRIATAIKSWRYAVRNAGTGAQ